MLILGLLISQETKAQINIGGEPLSFKRSLKALVPVETMPELNMEKVHKQDKEDDEQGLPPRFGVPHSTDLNLTNSGVWEDLENGEGKIWRLSIHCPSASSINLLYDSFWLPEGATLYIYNEDKSKMIGGFTSKNNKGLRGENIGYATGIIKGDEITLELFQSTDAKFDAEISISTVVHGYFDMTNDHLKGYGDSGSCQININCPDGNAWQNAKTSVALIVVGGTRWCTGSLLNSGGDFAPYFLTADHCLDGFAIPTPLDAVSNPNANNWMFYWEYEAAGCANPATEPSWTSTTGAYLVANKGDSDFALFHLTEDPFRDAGLGLTYNGWSTTNSPGAGGAGIHHPSGDVKKISLFTQTPNGNHPCSPSETWSVVFQHSSTVFTTTEPGSSGSPLYDNNGRVIGQLWGGVHATTCGGGPVCNDPANDLSYYGKFSTSWDDPAGETRRLKDWLEPTCFSNVIVPSNSTGVRYFYASQDVTSNKTISSSNAFGSFHGGNMVRLSAGFSVSNGAEFEADNDGCSNLFTSDDNPVLDLRSPDASFVSRLINEIDSQDQNEMARLTEESQREKPAKKTEVKNSINNINQPLVSRTPGSAPQQSTTNVASNKQLENFDHTDLEQRTRISSDLALPEPKKRERYYTEEELERMAQQAPSQNKVAETTAFEIPDFNHQDEKMREEIRSKIAPNHVNKRKRYYTEEELERMKEEKDTKEKD